LNSSHGFARLNADLNYLFPGTGSVWTSPVRIPESTIHKYETGSGSDRTIAGQIQVRIWNSISNQPSPGRYRSRLRICAAFVEW